MPITSRVTTYEIDLSSDEYALLEQATIHLGQPSVDVCAQTLVTQSLEESARRMGRDGRGKAYYRPRPRHH